VAAGVSGGFAVSVVAGGAAVVAGSSFFPHAPSIKEIPNRPAIKIETNPLLITSFTSFQSCNSLGVTAYHISDPLTIEPESGVKNQLPDLRSLDSAEGVSPCELSLPAGGKKETRAIVISRALCHRTENYLKSRVQCDS
jgi:hypothetical protein